MAAAVYRLSERDAKGNNVWTASVQHQIASQAALLQTPLDLLLALPMIWLGMKTDQYLQVAFASSVAVHALQSDRARWDAALRT